MQPVVALDMRLLGAQATGDSTYWAGLLNGLVQIEPEAKFLLCSNKERPANVPVSTNFEWVRIDSSRSRWWSLFRFPLVARRRGATVIHTQYSLSPLVGNTGVTTIHDVSFLIEPNWFKPKDRVLLSRFVRPSARRASRVITVSNTSKSEIVGFWPEVESKVDVVYNAAGKDIRPIERKAAKHYVESTLGIQGPFLLTVGTRWPRKNLDLAVKAATPLPTTLVITGKSGWGDEEQSSKVVRTGYVSDEDLSNLYSAAALYLAPSRHEGFGIPVLEAFLCGCPVMCSSGGALPEISGDAACVMPTWEATDWTERLKILLSDSSKLAEMTRLGRERESLFSWRRTAEQTFQIYSEVSHAGQ